MRGFAGRFFPASGWTALRPLIPAGVALPFLPLIPGLFSPESVHWTRVRERMLPTYVWETVAVASGTVAAAAVLGTALAWCVALHRFPGRRLFALVLPLPLAMPPYLAAYAYDGLLGYTGFAQATLRNRFGVDVNAYGVSVPPMLNAIFVFSITLYPYVYMFVLAYLRDHSAALMENAALLGGGGARAFFRVILPLSRPAIIAGATLVCLETMNDYGVVSHFGVHTFATAIFTAWFGMGEADTAARLALMLAGATLAILLVARALGKSQRYRLASGREKPCRPRKLEGVEAALAATFCLVCVCLCLVAPAAQMAAWTLMAWDAGTVRTLALDAWRSLGVAGAATAVIMFLALALALANHAYPGRASRLYGQAAGMGYAVPAAVLSIGTIMLFAALDRRLPLFRPPLGMTLAPLIFAYSARFFSIAHQAVENGCLKIGRTRSEAARTLGRGATMTFLLVDLPMLRPAVAAGCVLTFVDALKELPLALTLRPFNFDTLATMAHGFAHNEALPETGPPALVVVAVSACLILAVQGRNRERQT